MITRGEVLDALVASGDLDPSARSALDATPPSGSDGPWYMQAVALFGAWLASLILLVCMGIFTGGTQTGMILYGVLLIVAVLVTRRGIRGFFFRQCALATLVCGQLLVVFGAAWKGGEDVAVLLVAIVVTAALYALYPDAQHRFLSPFIPATIALWLGPRHLAPASVTGVELAMVVVAFVGPWPWRRFLRPLGLSMACALALTFYLTDRGDRLIPQVMVIGAAAACALRATEGRPSLIQLGGIAILGALSEPGILFGALLAGLGLARAERALVAFGSVYLTFFISSFYYWIDINLAQKSAVLVASGMAVLAIRSFLRAAPLALEEAS
jgi:hypothetical protein